MSTGCFGPFDTYVIFTYTSQKVLSYFSRVHTHFLEAAGGVVGIEKALLTSTTKDKLQTSKILLQNTNTE
jgi:hypothetical protein